MPERATTSSTTNLPATALLQKRLGLPFAIAIMAGSVIGAGILRTPGVVANEVPVAWVALLLWALGGAYVFLSVNVASELTTALPQAGGIYVPVRMAFGESLGLLTGWSAWAGFVAGGAALSLAFAEFLGGVFPFVAAHTMSVALAALGAVTLLNLHGVKEGQVMQIVGLTIKLALLVCVVIAAFVLDPVVATTTTAEIPVVATSVGGVALITAFQIVIGAYDGWQGPTFFAEENVDPARNIPRAFFQSAAIITVMYLAINLCVFAVLDMTALRSSALPVGLMIDQLLGPAARVTTGIMAALMALFTLNAVIMICSRIMFGMARDGLFLQSAIRVNRGGTPWVAMLIGAMVAVPLITSGAYVFVFKIQAALSVLASVLYNASYFKLRQSAPDLPRPFRAWGHPVLPALILLITVALLVAVLAADPAGGLWVAGLMAVCIPIGYVLHRRRLRLAAIQP